MTRSFWLRGLLLALACLTSAGAMAAPQEPWQRHNAAGLAGGMHVLTGHGAEPGQRREARALASDGFTVRTGDSIADARPLLEHLRT